MDKRAIYQEAGQVNRYFLNWRQGLIAGYFAILYGTASLVISACEKGNPRIVPVILAAAGFIGLAFAVAEWRNRECYFRASNVAREIEQSEKLPSLYGSLEEPPAFWPEKLCGKKVPGPHSAVIFLLYVGFATALLIAAFAGLPIAVCAK